MKLGITLLAMVTSLACTTAATAAVVLHTDLASYQAATVGAASTTLDDFDFTSGPLELDGNRLTFRSGIVSIASPERGGSNVSSGLTYIGSVDGDGDFLPHSITWELLPGTFGFAFDIYHVQRLIDPPTLRRFETVNLTVDDGSGPQTFMLHQHLPNENLRGLYGFLGFTGDAPISSVLFSGTGGLGANSFLVDDLRTASSAPPAVPLPASLPLALGAVSALMALGRRRTSRRERLI